MLRHVFERLGWNHPDPYGQQTGVLRRALRNIIEGEIKAPGFRAYGFGVKGFSVLFGFGLEVFGLDLRQCCHVAQQVIPCT